MFANDNQAPNNSVVLADSSNNIGTIYCVSGSRISGTGQWFAPNGVEITESSSSSLTIVRSNGNVPAYAGLQLKPGRSVTTNEEGIYTCVIPDERGLQRMLFVALYRYQFPRELKHIDMTSEIFQLFYALLFLCLIIQSFLLLLLFRVLQIHNSH